MGVSDNLINAVSKKDIQSIRDCLAASIVFDPNMTRGFSESLRYCLENGIAEDELYESHDGRSLNRPVTNDVFSDLCAELGTNFSRERIDAIRNVGRKLHPPKKGLDNEEHRSDRMENRKTVNMALPMAAFAIGGAIVGGMVGGLLLKKALIGAVIGVVGGAAVAVASSKKR